MVITPGGLLVLMLVNNRAGSGDIKKFIAKTLEVPNTFPIASNQFGIVCVSTRKV